MKTNLLSNTKTLKKIIGPKPSIGKILLKSVLNHTITVPLTLFIFSLENSINTCIIPIHENGGDDFWEEVKHRKLFDPRYAITADTSVSQYHCWPSD